MLGVRQVYDYIREYGLIDFEDLDTKFDGAFTWKLDDITYICSDPYMDYYNASMLMHEFEHTAHRLLNVTKSYNQDIIEIHSQGLEMLLALMSETCTPETF